MDRGLGAGVGTLQGLRGLVVTKSAGREGQTRSVGAQTVSFSSCNVTASPLSPCKNPPQSPPAHDPCPGCAVQDEKEEKRGRGRFAALVVERGDAQRGGGVVGWYV